MRLHFLCLTIFFLLGAKIHKAAGAIRIIEKSGKAYTIKEENENLQKDIQIYVHHANEVNIVYILKCGGVKLHFPIHLFCSSSVFVVEKP